MISSKLTAGFVALILVAATQIENSAAVAVEPVGYEQEHTLKQYNSCLAASTTFISRFLASSKAKAGFLRPKGLGGADLTTLGGTEASSEVTLALARPTPLYQHLLGT
jgi:hypothetical protein